ncbi:MAG TPA: response regulator transcription factor [Micromonosporaceae bacterium]|nr:response regulator transcription factor [Micromonosporaceae bacterium]
MRVLICDYQVVFAESLAHLLTDRGEHVVAVTHDLDRAAAVLREHPVDVCLLDVVFGSEHALDRLPELHRAGPRTHLVLLSARVDAALMAAARQAGVSGVADKRQPVADLIGLLDRVHAGVPEPPGARPAGPVAAFPRQRPANDTQRLTNNAQRLTNNAHRLAAYLTPRERQVLSALVCGENTTKLAAALGIAANTARCHIQSLLTKMGAHSRLEVATTAVRCGMVHPETGEWLIQTSQ